MKNRVIMLLLLSSLATSLTVGCAISSSKNKDIIDDELIVEEVIDEPEAQNEVEEEEISDALIYLGEFQLTAYCDCPICQEEWVGTTALGVAPTEEWTIAVDPDIIPLGSIVYIDGFSHAFRAEDVGGMINENHIDIFVGSHEECYNEIYNRYADVWMEVLD